MDDDADAHERQDITNQVHIKCAVCADFELCVDCMSAGATVAPHHADHAYRVMDSLAFPLFAADWSAAEELLLLHAIEVNGLGNWTEVRVVWAGRWAAAALARCPGWFGSAAEQIQTWFFSRRLSASSAAVCRPAASFAVPSVVPPRVLQVVVCIQHGTMGGRLVSSREREVRVVSSSQHRLTQTGDWLAKRPVSSREDTPAHGIESRHPAPTLCALYHPQYTSRCS